MVQFPIVLLVIITGTPPSLKLFSFITSLLFLNQLITARGLPVAVQVKLTSSPDVTVVFVSSSVMTGTTVTKIHNTAYIIMHIYLSTENHEVNYFQFE